MKYEKAGVPHEKMGFWLRVDELFSTLDNVATLSDEVHPLNALVSREHFSDRSSNVLIPVSITGALEKDQALLPQVCINTNIIIMYNSVFTIILPQVCI